MYNNFSSKKTKKVISALLASALVVTSAPITADAATTKVLGVKKTFTVKKTTKVSGLSKAEKKIVKVTVNKKKKTVTVKGVKPGKAKFKIGSKAYTVKVGAVKIKKKSFATTLTAGTNKSVSVTSSYGAKDKLAWSSSKTSVVKVSKSTTTADSKKVAKNTLKPIKAGSAKITVKSKNTGKSLTVTVKVKAATTPTVAPTATSGAVTTPSVEPTATTTVTSTPTEVPSGSATTAPTSTPSGSATTAPTEVPSGSAATATPEVPSGSATTAPTVDPGVTAVPTATTTPTQAPEVVSASVVSAAAVNTQDEVLSLDAVTKNGSIEVTFSETVKESSINNTNFTVTDANGKNISIPASDVKLAIGGKKAVVSIKNLGLDKKATYTLTVKNVETAAGDKVVDYKTTFTVANVAIINNVKLSATDANDELSTNMDATLNWTGVSSTVAADLKNDGVTVYIKESDGTYKPVAENTTFDADTTYYYAANAGWEGKQITVKYDELLDSTTVNAANIELTNTTTGERVPVTFTTSTTNGTITIRTNVALTAKNLYKLTIKGVKTAVNGVAEDLTHTFAVNGVAPLSDKTILSYKTLDGNAVVNSTTIWPKLTAGNKELNDTDTKYYAGIQINVAAAESLDATSVKECVYLVEKETKEIVAANVSYNEEAKMIVIVPAADLKEDTDYEIQYLGGLRTTDYVYLNSNKKNDVYTSETVGFKTMDATSPEVVSIESKSGTNGLEVTKAQEFVVTFTEGVSLSAGNILLTETSVDVESTTVAKLGVEVTEVAGSNGKQWTVKIPANSLTADKAYKLRVLGKDSKNWATKGTLVTDTYTMPNYLKKTSTYTFSTENDTNAPKLVNVYEGTDITDASKVLTDTKTNVKEGDKFTFVFDEKIQATAQAKLEVLEKGTWTNSNVTLTLASQNNKDGEPVAVTVTIPSTVNKDAKYRIVFEKGVIKDKANNDPTKCNEFDLYRYEFVATHGDDDVTSVNVYAGTDAKGGVVGNEGEATLPGTTTDSDGNLIGTVAIDARFFIVLDEKDITGLTSANVTVTDADGNAVAGEVKEVTDSTNTNFTGKAVYAFIPTANLSYATNYTVKLSGVTDIVGNKIATKAVTFKTVAALAKVTSITTENGALEDGADSINRKATIKVNFNNKLTSDTEPTITLYKKTDSDKTQVIGTAAATGSYNDDKNVYTIQAEGLDANTSYVLNITFPDGNTDNNKTITFTTGLEAKDVVKPELTTITVDGRNITKDKKNTLKIGDGTIILTFSEKLNKDDVKVEIVNAADTSKGATVLDTSLDDATGTILTITTAGMVTDGSDVYKVVISGIKDEAKNEADSITFYLANSASANNANLNTAEEETAELAEYKTAAIAKIDEIVTDAVKAQYTIDDLAGTVTTVKATISNVSYSGTISTDKSSVDTEVQKILDAAHGTATGVATSSFKLDTTYVSDAKTDVERAVASLSGTTGSDTAKSLAETALSSVSTTHSKVTITVTAGAADTEATVTIVGGNVTETVSVTATLS